MDRQAILEALIKFNVPLRTLKEALTTLNWDADPIIVLRRQDIAAVLRRFARGELDVATVEEWANLIECREDIEFEPGHHSIVARAIHELANPSLQSPLSEIADDLLAALGG